MILVQILMVGAAIALFFFGIRRAGAHSVQAWKKLIFTLLMAVVVVAVLSPDSVSWVAQLVGVGRGTDLVLYVVSLAFGFFVVDQYLKAQKSREELYRLARRIAIVEAVDRYRLSPRPVEPTADGADES